MSGIAVSVLAKLSPEFALPMLIDKLNDLNINVRLSAARQLLIIDPKQPAALKTILEFLETGTFSASRDYAIETLSEASADAKEAIAVLQKITKEDRETSTKRRARLSLERIKRRGAIQQSQAK